MFYGVNQDLEFAIIILCIIGLIICIVLITTMVCEKEITNSIIIMYISVILYVPILTGMNIFGKNMAKNNIETDIKQYFNNNNIKILYDNVKKYDRGNIIIDNTVYAFTVDAKNNTIQINKSDNQITINH